MQPLRSVVAIASVCATFVAWAASVTFPGPLNHTTDPTGRFEVRWSEPNGSSSHQLLFASVGSPRATPFFAFERSAAVRWAPQGTRFALTNHKGSDNSEVLVFAVPPAQPTDILSVLPPRARSLVESNHHSYVEAVAWNHKGLTIHAHGYGDRSPNGFSMHVQCRERHEQWYCR